MWRSGGTASTCDKGKHKNNQLWRLYPEKGTYLPDTCRGTTTFFFHNGVDEEICEKVKRRGAGLILVRWGIL